VIEKAQQDICGAPPFKQYTTSEENIFTIDDALIDGNDLTDKQEKKLNRELLSCNAVLCDPCMACSKLSAALSQDTVLLSRDLPIETITNDAIVFKFPSLFLLSTSIFLKEEEEKLVCLTGLKES
jgi:hypothetical protein